MTLMACTLVAVVAAGTSFHTTSSLLSGHLQYVANSKRDAIVAMLDTAKREIEALQTNPALQEAADTLDMGFAALPLDLRVEVDRAKRAGENLDALARGPGEFYVNALIQTESWLSRFAREHSYENIFIINTKGDVIYSTGRSPLGSPENYERLAVALATVGASGGASTTEISAPTAEGPGGFFFAAPIASAAFSGEAAGVLIVEISTRLFAGLLNDPTGFGESGEALLTASDGTQLSNSRFGALTERTPLDADLLTGTVAFGHHRGTDVVGTAAPIEWSGKSWKLVAVESSSEVLSPALTMVLQIGGITFCDRARCPDALNSRFAIDFFADRPPCG